MDQDPIKKIQSTNPIDIRAAIDIASGGDDNAEVDINKFEDALIGQTTLAARVGFKRAKAFFKGMVGQESAGGKDLTSVDGARGAYQVMPDTAKKYKMDVNDPYQNRFMGISYWDEGFRKAIEANNANIGTDTVSLAGAATAYYHGGPGAFNKLSKTGRYSAIADGAGMTTDDHVLTVLKNWDKNLQDEGFGGALKLDDEVAQEQAEKGIYKLDADGSPIVVVDSSEEDDPSKARTSDYLRVIKQTGANPDIPDSPDVAKESLPKRQKPMDLPLDLPKETLQSRWVWTDGDYDYTKIPSGEEVYDLARRTFPVEDRPNFDMVAAIYKQKMGITPFKDDSPETIQAGSEVAKDSTGKARRIVGIGFTQDFLTLMDIVKAQGAPAAAEFFDIVAARNSAKLQKWKDETVPAALAKLDEAVNKWAEEFHPPTPEEVAAKARAQSTVPGAFLPGISISGAFANARAFFNSTAGPDSKIASTAQLAEQEWNNFVDSVISGGLGIAGAVIGRTMGGDSILNQREWADHLDNTLTSYSQQIARENQVALDVTKGLFKQSGAADYKWNLPVTALLGKSPMGIAAAQALPYVPYIGNKIPTIEIHPYELGKDVIVGAAQMAPVMAASMLAGPVGGMYYYGLYSSLLRGQPISEAGGEALFGALQGATMHSVGEWMHKVPALYRPTISGTLMGGTSTFSDYRKQMDEWNALPDSLKAVSPKPSLTFNNFVKNAALNTLLSITEVLPKESSVLHSLEIFNRNDIPSIFKGVMAAESLGILPTASREVTAFQRGGLETLNSMATTPLEHVPSDPSALRSTIEVVNKTIDGYLNALSHKTGGGEVTSSDEFASSVASIQKKGAEILSGHLQNAKTLLGDIYEKLAGNEPLTEDDKKGFLHLINGVNSIVQQGFGAVEEVRPGVEAAIKVMNNSDQARGSLEIAKNIGGTTVHEVESLNDPRGSSEPKRIENGVVNVGTFHKPGTTMGDPDSIGHFVTVIEADGTKHTFEVDADLAEVYRNRQRAIGRAVAEGASEETVTNLVAENQLSPVDIQNLSAEHSRRLQEEYDAKQAEIVKLLVKPEESRTPEEQAQVDNYLKKEATIESLRQLHGGDEPRWVTEARWRSLKSQSNMLPGYLPSLDLAVTTGWDLLKAGKTGMDWYNGLVEKLNKIRSFPTFHDRFVDPYNEYKFPKQAKGDVVAAILPYANSIYDNAMFLKGSKVVDRYETDKKTGEVRPARGSIHTPYYHSRTSDYEKFDMNMVGSMTDPGWYGAGAYYGPYDVASGYNWGKTGLNFSKSWISMKNPIYYRLGEDSSLDRHIDQIRLTFGTDSDGVPYTILGHNTKFHPETGEPFLLPKGMDQAADIAANKLFNEFYNLAGKTPEEIKNIHRSYVDLYEANRAKSLEGQRRTTKVEDDGKDIIDRIIRDHGSKLSQEQKDLLYYNTFAYVPSMSSEVLSHKIAGETGLNLSLDRLEALRNEYNRLKRENRPFEQAVYNWSNRANFTFNFLEHLNKDKETQYAVGPKSFTLAMGEKAAMVRMATDEAIKLGYDGVIVLRNSKTVPDPLELDDPYGDHTPSKTYYIEEVAPFSSGQIRNYYEGWTTRDSFNGQTFDPTKPPLRVGRETGQDGFSINPIIMIADLYHAQKRFTREMGAAFNRAFKYKGIENPALMASITRFTSESQTARLAMQQFAQMSQDALDKAGISHDDYLTTLIYDRLDGLKNRWHGWAKDAHTLSDDEFINKFNIAGGQTEVDWRTAIASIHHNLGKTHGWVVPVADVMAELRNAAYTNDFSTVRTVVSNLFDRAGGEVNWESPSFSRADYDAVKNDPAKADALKQADFYYKSTVEAPLRYSFNLTDNSPTTALGPRQLYFPLIHQLDPESDEGFAAASGMPKPGALSLGQLQTWYKAKREYLDKVYHPAARFATGFKEYTTDTAQAVGTMVRQIRAGNVAGTVDTLKQMGLVLPAIVDPVTGKPTAPGPEYVLLPTGTKRTFMVKEEIAGVGLTSYFTPKTEMMYAHQSVMADVGKLLDTNSPDNMNRLELLSLATGIYLKGITDFIIHSQNQIDAVRRNMGFLPANYFNTDTGSTPVKLGKSLLNLAISGLGKVDVQGLPSIIGTALGLPAITVGALSALAPRVVYSFFKVAENSTTKDFAVGDKKFSDMWSRAWDVVQSGSAPTEYGIQTFDPKTANETGAPLVGLYRSPMIRNMLRRLGMDVPEPKNAQDLEDVSKAGMIFGKIINLSPSIFGFDGVDMRGRMAVAESINHYAPDATPWQKFQIFAGMGVYNKYFESQIGGMLKSIGFSPFYSAASAGLRRGIQSWTNATGSEGLTIMRDASKMSAGEKTAFTVRSALSNSAFSYTAAWAMNWHASTGKWPWEDSRARYGQVIQDQDVMKETEGWFPSWFPAKDLAEQARTAVKEWSHTGAVGKGLDYASKAVAPDPSKDLYITLDPINGVLRGARALGIKPFFDTIMKLSIVNSDQPNPMMATISGRNYNGRPITPEGENQEARSLAEKFDDIIVNNKALTAAGKAATASMGNSLVHLGLSNPIPHMLSVAGLGSKLQFYNEYDPVQGGSRVVPFSIDSRTQQGLGVTAWRRFIATAGALNSLSDNVESIATGNSPNSYVDIDQSSMAQSLKVITDLALRTVFQQINAEGQSKTAATAMMKAKIDFRKPITGSIPTKTEDEK